VTTTYVLRACPSCKEQHSDWESRLRSTVGPSAMDVSALPQTGSA
jgi:hypothetical protein